MARLPLLGALVGRAHLLLLVAALVLVAGCSAAGAIGWGGEDDPVAAYEEALAPLKERSDVLEEKFAAVRGSGGAGPEAVREVLQEIIPEYAELLEETRAIEVDDPELQKAHEALVASLERQQEGLELALRGLQEGDSDEVGRAGVELKRAQALVEKHRRLLAAARD